MSLAPKLKKERSTPNLVKKTVKKILKKWVNVHLIKSSLHVEKIDDLVENTLYLAKLINNLWDENLCDEIDFSKIKTHKEKYQILDDILESLKNKQKIVIKREKIYTIIDMEIKYIPNSYDLTWKIIKDYLIDWISYYGRIGKEGLLDWCSSIMNIKINDFNESWKDGKLYNQLLKNTINHFLPNEIINSDKNSPYLNAIYYIIALKNNGCKIYIDPESIETTNEDCIVLQCAELYHHFRFSSLIKDEMMYNPNEMTRLDINQNKNLIVKVNNFFHPIIPSRKPILVSEIDKNLEVHFYEKEFKHAIQRAGSRPIIFVSCIGRYELGKSTIISCLSSNLGFNIGNHVSEKTKGVYIDGPYELDYFYQRFKVRPRPSIFYLGNEFLTPLIYFFDIEGYGGIIHGDDVEKNNKAFNEMSTPFLCLSSIFLYLSDPNPNMSEIDDLIKRFKISNLTTYSNDEQSNGSLNLLIVLNKYDEPTKRMQKYDPLILKENVLAKKELLKKGFNGRALLDKYGIKYYFVPILTMSNYMLNGGFFYDLFQQFAKKVIKNIEKAAEGFFMRCGKESIELFNFIHNYDESNWDIDIKNKIREEHNNSIKTILQNACEYLKNKILPQIDEEFKYYYENINIELDIISFKNNCIKKANKEINKILHTIQDYKEVNESIQSLVNSLQKHINFKYDAYLKQKNDKINEIKNKLEKETNSHMKILLEEIQEEYKSDTSMSHDQNEINQKVEKSMNTIRDHLIEFKRQQQNELITDKMIEDTIEVKRNMINSIITTLDLIEKKEILQKKIKIKQIINSNFQQRILELCWEIVANNVKDLQNKLKDIEFYASNYQKTPELTTNIKNLIIDELNPRLNEIINDICFDICEKNKKYTKITTKLQKENEIDINISQIKVIIDQNEVEIQKTIDKVFEYAKDDLAIVVIQKRNRNESLLYYCIEIRKNIKYPDKPVIQYGKWSKVRQVKKNFKDIMTPLNEIPVDVTCYKGIYSKIFNPKSI